MSAPIPVPSSSSSSRPRMSIYGPPLSQTQSQSRPSHRRDLSNSSAATSSSSLSASPSSFTIGSSPAPSTPSTMTTSPPTSSGRLSVSPSRPVFGPPPSSSPYDRATSSSPSRPIQHVTLSYLLAYSQEQVTVGQHTHILWDIREHPLRGGARLAEHPELPGLSPYVLSQTATQPGCVVLHISCDFFPRPWPIRVVAAPRDGVDNTNTGSSRGGRMLMSSSPGQGPSNSNLSWHGIDMTPTASTSTSTTTGTVAPATRLVYPSPPMVGPIGPPASSSSSSPDMMMSILPPSPPRPPLIPLPDPSHSLPSSSTIPSPQAHPYPIPSDEDPITIQDVLLAIHTALHKRISQSEWDSLSSSQKDKMTRKYEERCLRVAEGDEARWARARKNGVLRVDCLMEHTVFGGLTMSMEQELTGILTLRRPVRGGA